MSPRPPDRPPYDLAAMRALVEAGWTKQDVARHFDCAASTVHRACFGRSKRRKGRNVKSAVTPARAARRAPYIGLPAHLLADARVELDAAMARLDGARARGILVGQAAGR